LARGSDPVTLRRSVLAKVFLTGQHFFLQKSPQQLSSAEREVCLSTLFGKLNHHSYDLDRRRNADNPIEYVLKHLTTLTDAGARFLSQQLR
jgi:hypothetical protein